MSVIDKLIQKILDGKQLSYKESERILFSLGFAVKVTGSHHIFIKAGTVYNISLKKRAHLLPYQIKMLRRMLINHGYKNE